MLLYNTGKIVMKLVNSKGLFERKYDPDISLCLYRHGNIIPNSGVVVLSETKMMTSAAKFHMFSIYPLLESAFLICFLLHVPYLNY